jgi:hypothetical protein
MIHVRFAAGFGACDQSVGCSAKLRWETWRPRITLGSAFQNAGRCQDPLGYIRA